MSFRLKVFLAAFLMSGFFASICLAESPQTLKSIASNNENIEEVELFSAIDAGQVDVKVIAKSAKESKLIFTNKTKDTLKVDLPKSFALVPVAAQSFGSGSSSTSSSSSGSQSSGGGYSGSRGGSSSFNLLPDQKKTDTVKTVCLEHGKKNPSPRMAYSIRPIQDVTENKAVHLLCEKVGAGDVDQQSAQAAVWHLNNDVSWEELAKEHHVNEIRTKVFFFTPAEIREGYRLAGKAAAVVAQEEAEKEADVAPSLSESD